MGNHIVFFVFVEESDTDKVLMGELSSYDKYLISLQKMDKNVLVKDLAFTKTLFWVQIHDLPLGDMNLSAACAIGSSIGVVQEGLKEWDTQDGSSFMRIRVLMDMLKPLCRGRKIYGDDGKVGWIRFKYERLPNLCYWCGLLSHSDKDCDIWVQSKGTHTEQDQQFGGWLRVPPITEKVCSAV